MQAAQQSRLYSDGGNCYIHLVRPLKEVLVGPIPTIPGDSVIASPVHGSELWERRQRQWARR